MKIFGDNLATFMHWFAWTLSIAASAFFLIFLIGEDIPALIKNPNSEFIYFLPWLIVAIAGSLISLFHRKTGAIMMLIGGIAMVTYFYFQSGLAEFSMMVVYGLPYIVGGFLLWVVKK
jgi:ABC-type amino acid transport system permease subunit